MEMAGPGTSDQRQDHAHLGEEGMDVAGAGLGNQRDHGNHAGVAGMGLARPANQSGQDGQAAAAASGWALRPGTIYYPYEGQIDFDPAGAIVGLPASTGDGVCPTVGCRRGVRCVVHDRSPLCSRVVFMRPVCGGVAAGFVRMTWPFHFN